MKTKIKQINNLQQALSYQTPIVVGTEIQLEDTGGLPIKFKLDTAVTGGVITISTDGGVTSIALKDGEGNDVTELTQGLQEVAYVTPFFILRSGGGLKINALIDEYVVEAGNTINAGDFVKYFNGKVKEYTDEIILTNGYTMPTPGLNLLFGVCCQLNTTTVIYLYKGTAQNYLVITPLVIEDGGFVVKPHYTESTIIPSHADIISVSDTKFIVSVRDNTGSPYPGYLYYFNFNGASVSLLQKKTFTEATSLENSRLLKINDTMALLLYGDNINNGNYLRTVTIATNSLTINTRVSLPFYFSIIKRHSLTVISPDIILYGLTDPGDGGKAKAVIISISGTTPTINTILTVDTANCYEVNVVRMSNTRALFFYTVGTVRYMYVLGITGTTVTIISSKIVIDPLMGSGWMDGINIEDNVAVVCVPSGTTSTKVMKIKLSDADVVSTISSRSVLWQDTLRQTLFMHDKFNFSLFNYYNLSLRYSTCINTHDIFGVAKESGIGNSTIKVYTK